MVYFMENPHVENLWFPQESPRHLPAALFADDSGDAVAGAAA